MCVLAFWCFFSSSCSCSFPFSLNDVWRTACLYFQAKSSKHLLGGGNNGKGGGGQGANNVANERFAVREWQGVVQDTLQGLSQNTTEYIWPRDILFGYLQRMERLQNNMKEYQDLQHLAATAIHNMYKAIPVPGGVHTGEGETGAEAAKK